MPVVLSVKNMVCYRCVLAVEGILKEAQIPYQQLLIGEIHLGQTLSATQKQQLSGRLNNIGFELIDNHLSALIEKIKHLVIKKARNEVDKKDKPLNVSFFLSGKLHYEYTYLSSLFSSVEGRTIENYFIEQRIEKAKELLIYGDKSLSEIAYALEYSSTAHLSSQFKKVTGLTPSHFKSVGLQKRRALDQV
ncbi:MAG TPA: AraC family transcriptional regulator [Bacteroidia bacterium]|nr:AraC family transcriptional regulator [Bacteroidia bacterium]